MNFPPTKPLKDDLLPQMPTGWTDAIKDYEVVLCSAALLLAIRSGKRGSRMLRLYILGKALRKWLEVRSNPHPYLPLRWFRTQLKPFFPKGFRQAWEDAVDANLIKVFPESNSVTITSPRNEESWTQIFELLGMRRRKVEERNSFDDIVWTTHTLICVRYYDVFNLDWDEQRERVAFATTFMWGLNHNEYFLTLATFGRLFGVTSKTVMRWSRTSGEFAQRRCIPVVGAPWVPAWEKEDRPPQLQQVKKPIPNPNTPQFKMVSRLLEQTRMWSDNGHRTRYFNYYHKQKNEFTLARRIPNYHKPRRGRKIRTGSPDSNDWCQTRNKYPFHQYFKKPLENERLWFTRRQLKSMRKKVIKERRMAHYESLDEIGKAEFRERVKETISGRRMAYEVYDPMLGDFYLDLYPMEHYTDAGTWAEKKIWGNYNSHTEDTNLDKQPGDRPMRNIVQEILQSRGAERIWKHASLNGADGSEQFGVNTFTTSIAPVYGRIKTEWEKLFPDRNRIVQWARVYNLGHKKIRAKPESIRCSHCNQKISHLPHPAYHTSCPRCQSKFALGVAGMVL